MALTEAINLIEFLRTKGIKRPDLFMGSCGEICVSHISNKRKICFDLELMGDQQILVSRMDSDSVFNQFIDSVTELPEEFIEAMRKFEEETYGPTGTENPAA